MIPGKSEGFNWLARHQGDPRQPWKVERVDAFPTSHHVAWADFDGDGTRELVNAPLLGPNGLAPTYDQDKASIFWYSPSDWKRHVVTQDIPGIIHRVRVVKWDGTNRDQLVVSSFEGIAVYRAKGTGADMTFEKELLSAGHAEKAPRLGASDAGVGQQDGKKFFASVEPWHGNEVVVYTEGGRLRAEGASASLARARMNGPRAEAGSPAPHVMRRAYRGPGRVNPIERTDDHDGFEKRRTPRRDLTPEQAAERLRAAGEAHDRG
jgi:hypothetical protein